METSPRELKETFDTLYQFVEMEAQAKRLTLALEAMQGLAELFLYFEKVRELHQPEFSPNHDDLMAECQRLLLKHAPEKKRYEIRASALDYADRVFTRGCKFSELAKAEVLLRKVFLLSLEAAASSYEGRARLQDWNLKIAEEQAKLNRIEKEWQATIASTN